MGGALAYYNEIDPFAAQVLRELIAEGVIAPGVVDERSIEDVRPDELSRFTQCHFFAGGGVWSYALRRAGWPDWLPIWTGSCPCQPFSTAGKGAEFDDKRHLWPAWQWLIEQCEPECVAGEQVADKGADAWLDLVQADLEGMGYAFGCVPLASAGFGAPNPRHRSFWMAHAAGLRFPGIGWGGQDGAAEYSDADRLGNALRDGAGPVGGNSDCPQGPVDGVDGNISRASVAARDAGAVGGMADTSGERHEWCGSAWGWRDGFAHGSPAFGLGHTDGQPCERDSGSIDRTQAPLNGERVAIHGPLRDGPEFAGDVIRLADPMRTGWPERRTWAGCGPIAGSCGASDRAPGPVNGFWADADWLYCRDPRGPRWRPVNRGTFPLAPSAPARVGTLRVSGNAINAEVATGFIEAVIAHLAEHPLPVAEQAPGDHLGRGVTSPAPILPTPAHDGTLLLEAK